MRTKATARGRHVDWQEVHQRLERIRTAVTESWAPGPDEQRRVLRERARALAAPPPAAGLGETVEVVGFQLAQEHYGIETAHVREVFPLVELARVPCTPAFVMGIVNAWGEIVSVIDLRQFFGLPTGGLTDLNRVIILHSEAMTFGILADAVIGVRQIPWDDIQPTLPTLTGIREDYLLGVSGERLVILDGAKLLGDRKLVVQETVDAGGG